MSRTAIILLLFLGIFFSCDPDKDQKGIQVVIQVEAPELGASDTIFIAGAGALFGNWRPDGLALEYQSGKWNQTIQLDSLVQLEFKFTRGSWETEALQDDGNPPSNYSVKPSKDTTLSFVVNSWKQPGDPIPLRGQVTGTLKYHKNFPVPGLDPRTIAVWLPPDYESAQGKRYPVLYAHDGQNMFDPSTSSFGVDWGVDEIADSLIRNKIIQPVIVVGIYNSDDRSKEYAPFPEGDQYMDFIVDKLKPFIDSVYNTLPDRKHTATIGSSSGGLIAFMLAWEHDEVFSKAACFSPAFQYEQKSSGKVDYVKEVSNYEGSKKPIEFYIDNGTLGVDDYLQPGVDEMLKVLQTEDYLVKWFFAEGAAHNEAAWHQRVYRPLLQFYAN